MSLNILCFGDSITYGNWDTYGGWVERLKEHINSKRAINQYPRVYNLGITGDTMIGLEKRFETEATTRISPGDQNIAIFAYGMNDLKRFKDKYRTDANEFFELYEAIIIKSKSLFEKVYILNITPVIDALASLDPENYRTNKDVSKYNKLIEQLAKTQAITLIDVNSEFEKSDFNKFVYKDGIHPNDNGHKFIFETVKNKLLL